MHVQIDLKSHDKNWKVQFMSNVGNGRHFGKSIYGQCVSNKFLMLFLTYAR